MKFFPILPVCGALLFSFVLGLDLKAETEHLSGKVGVDKATFILRAEKAHPPVYYVNVFLDQPAADGQTELKALRVYADSELKTPDGPLEYGDRIAFDYAPVAGLGPFQPHPFSELTSIHITGKGTQQERDFANRK